MTEFERHLNALSGDQKRVLARRLHHAGHLMPQASLRAFVTANGNDLDPSQMRKSVAQALPPYMVPDVITQLETMPRLPNGKTDRKALVDQPVLQTRSQPDQNGETTPVQDILLSIFGDLLGLDDTRLDDNFFEFGGDSILGIQFVARAREAGLAMDPKHLMQFPTVAEMGQVVNWRVATKETPRAQSFGTGPVLPVQAWFLNRTLAAPDQWNLSRQADLRTPVTRDQIQSAVDTLWQSHPALRARFSQTPNGNWVQTIDADTPPPKVATATTPDWGAPETEAFVHHQQTSLSIQNGPLFQVGVLTNTTTSKDRVLLIAHHLVVDVLSWDTLMGDFDACLANLAPRPASTLSHSYLGWAKVVHDYAQSSDAKTDISHWDIYTSDTHLTSGTSTEGTSETLDWQLSPAGSDALNDKVHQAFQTRTLDFLVAALAQTISICEAKTNVLVDLEAHGRDLPFEGWDMSRTVGWMTTYFPIQATLTGAETPIDHLKTTKETLRTLPKQGMPFGAARFHSDGPTRARLDRFQNASVLLNFMGQRDAGHITYHCLSHVASLDAHARNAKNARSHPYELNLWQDKSGLRGVLVCDQTNADTARQILTQFSSSLEALISACLDKDVSGYTPSDFPDIDLSQDELDQLLDSLD